MISTAQQIEDFARETRVFCRWATGEDGTKTSAKAALRRIASLYNAALYLPPTSMIETSGDTPNVEIPSDALGAVLSRAAELPVDIYWEVFDPLTQLPEEPVAGSIVDDLGDIYRDVAVGLMLFEAGDSGEALWQWAFHFEIHWGKHATEAMRALHAYCSSENPDSLLAAVDTEGPE
jgi:hypothetical protein